MKTLTEMTMAELVAEHNALTGKTIKKFETKAIGMARVAALRTTKPIAKARKVSVSARCQSLLLAGRTTAEVWPVIQAEFGLDESKKHYPRWNQAMLVRTGKLLPSGWRHVEA